MLNKNCIFIYEGKEYTYDQFRALLADGLYDSVMGIPGDKKTIISKEPVNESKDSEAKNSEELDSLFLSRHDVYDGFSDIELEKDIIRSLLGDDFVNNKLTIKPISQNEDGSISWGQVRRNVLSINYGMDRKTISGVARHEAMHWVMTNIIDKNSYKNVINDARYLMFANEGISNPSERDVNEWIANKYSSDFSGKFLNIKGFLGDFLRWIYALSRRMFFDINEVDMLMSQIESGFFKKSSMNDSPNFFDELNMSVPMSEFFKDQKIPIESLKALMENGDITRKEKEEGISLIIRPMSWVKQEVFGSDYAYTIARSILMDVLSRNGRYSNSFYREIVYGYQAGNVDNQIYSTWKEFQKYKNDLELKQINYVQGGEQYLHISHIGSDVIREMDIQNNYKIFEQYSQYNIAIPDVFARMVQEVYEVDLGRIHDIITNGDENIAPYMNEIESDRELDIQANLSTSFDTQSELAENTIYRESRSSPVFSKTSKTVRFRLNTIREYDIVNDSRFNTETDSSGIIKATRTGRYIKAPVLENLLKDVVNSSSMNDLFSDTDGIKRAVAEKIASLPNSSSDKSVLMSFYYEMLDEIGISSSMITDNRMPVISTYAMMKSPDGSDIWRELANWSIKVNGLNGVSPDSLQEIKIGPNTYTRSKFMSDFPAKQRSAEELYNAVMTHIKNVSFVPSSKARIVNQTGKFVIEESQFSSNNEHTSMIRSGINGLVYIDQNEKYNIYVPGISYAGISNYDPALEPSAQFIVDPTGIFIRDRASDSNKKYIKFLLFENGQFKFPEDIEGSRSNIVRYSRKFLSNLGLNGVYRTQKTWNYIYENNGEEFVKNIVGMYAVLSDLGIASTIPGIDIRDRWSYKYRMGPNNSDKIFSPLKNNNENFYWPSDLASANKEIALAVTATGTEGFPSSSKDVRGNNVYSMSAKSNFSRFIPAFMEIRKIDSSGKQVTETIFSSSELPTIAKNNYDSGHYLHDSVGVEIPNTLINDSVLGALDKIISYTDSDGIEGLYGKSEKDKNLLINDESNMQMMMFANGLFNGNSGTSKDYTYTVPISLFGDKETKYVKIMMHGVPILSKDGSINYNEISKRIESLFDYYYIAHEDSKRRWKSVFDSLGVSGGSIKEIVEKINSMNPDQKNEIFKKIKRSRLIKIRDYSIKNGNIVPGRAASMSHEIFNYNNYRKIKDSKNKSQSVKEIFHEKIQNFGKLMSGMVDNSVTHHKIPDGFGDFVFRKGMINPYYEGYYFIQFIADKTLMPLIANDAYSYKDTVDMQKRLSQMVTPMWVAEDGLNVLGANINAVVFEDLKVEKPFKTGIGIVEDMSITDGYAIMNPVFKYAYRLSFGGDAGMMPKGNQKLLGHFGGYLWKASWGVITDDQLYIDDEKNPNGFSYFNIIKKSFIDPQIGESFVNDLKKELKAKESSDEQYSAIDRVSEVYFNKFRNTDGASKMENHVISFLIADSGLKTQINKVTNLNDEVLSDSIIKIPKQMFGMINDPSQKIDEDPRASLPIQTVTQTAWASKEQSDKVYDIWEKIIKSNYKNRELDLENVRKIAMASAEKSGGFGEVARMLSDENVSDQLPGLGNVIFSSFIAKTERTIRFSIPGARITQAPGNFAIINGKKLEPVKFDSKVEPGTCVMPHMFLDKFLTKKQLKSIGGRVDPEVVLSMIKDPDSKNAFKESLYVFASRVPSGGLNSGFFLKIAAFVNDNQNSIYLPAEINSLNGADNDIDQLQVWSYRPSFNRAEFKTTIPRDENSTSGLINMMLDSIKDIYSSSKNSPFTGSTTDLTIPDMVRDFALENSNSQTDAITWGSSDDATGSIVRKNIVSQGSVTIGRYANLSKAVSLIKRSSALKSGYKISDYAIQEIDKWLNAALDNEKHNILGVLNAHPDVSEFIIAYVAMNYDPNKKWKIGDKEMVGPGHTFMDIYNILKTPAMKFVIDSFQSMNSVTSSAKSLGNDHSTRIFGESPKIIDLLAMYRRDNQKENIDEIEKIAVFGEVLNIIGNSMPVTGIPKTEAKILNLLSELSSLMETDIEDFLESGKLEENEEKRSMYSISKYAPFDSNDDGAQKWRDIDYFARRQYMISQVIDGRKFVQESGPVLEAIKITYNEYKKMSNKYIIDFNEKIGDLAQKAYNEILRKRGTVNSDVLEKVRQHFSKFVMSSYFSSNGKNIKFNSDPVEMYDGSVSIDPSIWDLTTYSGRMAFMMTTPIWLNEKVNQYAKMSKDHSDFVWGNMFWSNIELDSGDGGITVFKMKNMNKIKNIKEDIKHDAYRLLNKIDPTGNSMNILKTYHMLLNGFGYGKGSMSVVFEPNEFYDISSWIDNSFIPAIMNYESDILEINGSMTSAKKIIEAGFYRQLPAVLIDYLPRDPSPTQKEKIKFAKNSEKNIQMSKLTWLDAFSNSYGARFKKQRSKDGILKIKKEGVEDLLMQMTREIGFNVQITGDIYTTEMVIRTANGDNYINLQQFGKARLITPSAGISIGSTIFIDGIKAEVVNKNNQGQSNFIEVKIDGTKSIVRSHKDDSSLDISDSDLEEGKTTNPLKPC